MHFSTKNLPFRQPGGMYMIDASQWDFKQQPGKLGVHPNNPLIIDDLTDVILTKEGIDYPLLDKFSLFNVGGYFHWHDTSADGVYIQNAFLTQRRLQTHHIGILNVEEISDQPISIHRFTPEMIQPADRKQDVWDRIALHIDIPESHILNKDIGMSPLIGIVLCGELYWCNYEPEIVKLTSHQNVVFNLSRWQFYQKVFKYKDLFGYQDDKVGQALHFGLTPYLDGRIKASEIKELSFIRTIFTLPQSFYFIVYPKAPITHARYTVGSHGLPKRYFCGKHRYAPLRISDGRYLPYISQQDRNGIVLVTEENRIYPQQMDGTIREELDYLYELNVSARKGTIQLAKFVDIRLTSTLQEGDIR